MLIKLLQNFILKVVTTIRIFLVFSIVKFAMIICVIEFAEQYILAQLQRTCWENWQIFLQHDDCILKK